MRQPTTEDYDRCIRDLEAAIEKAKESIILLRHFRDGGHIFTMPVPEPIPLTSTPAPEIGYTSPSNT